MSKRILSLLLCFAMVLTSLVIVPVTAITYVKTQIKVIPDKTTAVQGDVINYSVVMGPVSDLGSLQMELVIPEGLTYKPGTGKITDGLMEEMGFDALDWTEESLIINGGASAADYNSDQNTTLGTFSCTVDEDFFGTVAVDLTYLEFYSCQTWDDHTERFSVVTTPITVAPPAGVFEDATEVFFAGAAVTAEKPYIMQPMKSNPNTQASEDPCVASDSPIPAAGQKFLATFDAETSTITFNSGYELIEKDGTVEPEGDWNSFSTMQLMSGSNTKYGIKANGNLTIDLNGYTNGFWLDWNNHIKDVNTCGIYVEGDLTIKGDGYLRVTASAPQDVDDNYADSYTAYGVYAAGDVNFDGGMVYFFERPYVDPVAGDTATFVHAEGDITLNGGDVKMRGMKRSTWLTKFNKEPIYDSNQYYMPNVSDIEIEHAELQTLGFTRYVAGGSYNNTNNVSYMLKRPTLTFDVDGGDPITAITVKKGSVVDLAEYVPTKSGYIFRGWYSDSALTTPVDEIEVIEDTTVYAKFEIPTEYFTLTFDSKGGSAIAPAEELEGTVIDLSGYTPTNGELVFGGWFADSELTEAVTEIVLREDTTVYAKWVRSYTLTFEVDGGAPIAPVEVLEGVPVDLASYTTTKDGLIFDGWFNDAKLTRRRKTITISEDTTVYAKWTKDYGTYTKVDEAPAPVPGTSPATEVWYANAKLNSETPYLYGTSAANAEMFVMSSASDVAPDGYSLLATFKNGELTYARGFSPSLGWNTYTSFVEVPELSTEKMYGIHANGDLVINMGLYNHFFYSNTIKGHALPMEGIHVDGNLTLNGIEATMKLSVNPAMGSDGWQSYGIWAKGNVYLNGVTVYMYSALTDYEDQTIKENDLTFIKAENVVLDYGSIRLRGRHQATSPGIKKYEAYLKVLRDGYTWDDAKKINIIDPRALGDQFQTVQDMYWNNENNLDLTSPLRNQVIFGTAMLNSDYPYAIPNPANASVSTYLASASPEGSVAEYDAVNNVLTITKSITIDSQKSIYKMEADLEPEDIPAWDVFPYKAIEAKHDLNIVINKNVDVVITSRPFGDNSVARPIYSPGNINISGGGTLQIYSSGAWGTGTRDEANNLIYHYSSSPIWAHGKLTISGITAYLITNFDEPDGKSGHAMYGGTGIEFKDYASVYASTKEGKLLNTVPTVYDGSTVMVAEEGIMGTGLPAAASPIIPYNPATVLGMKYIQVSPTPLEIESISNLDENGLIKVSDPSITFHFNVLLDQNITSENINFPEKVEIFDGIFINGSPVSLDNLTVGEKTITLDLGGIVPNSIYLIEFKKIKNEAGIEFTGTVVLGSSSGVDIGDVTLNGDVNGAVAVGDNNTVAVQVDKAAATSASEVLVIATVYNKVEIDGEQVKVRRDVASKKQSITASTTVLVEGLTAQAGDIIEVFIWNNEKDIRPVKKTVVFGN